jgi:Domain of unknown function (DUF4340)
MTWPRALAYWACFIVLGGYYLVALREPSRQVPAHLTRAPFLNVPEGEVDALELRRGATVVRCRRIDGRWRVVEPSGTTVPSDLLAALVANVTQLPDVEVVGEGGGDLGQFGLAPPVSQMTLRLTGGQARVLRFGSRNPSGTAIYAQRDDGPRVFLVGLNVRYYEDLVFQGVPGA